MKFRQFIPALMLLLSLASCKEEETTKEYMDGRLNIKHDMPAYVTPGSKYTFSASGIVAPDGTEVGYCYQAPITKKIDTVATYVYTVPDTLGTFGVSIIAFPKKSADKYYSSTSTVYFTIVSEKSLQGIPVYAGVGHTSMHGRDYPTYRAGGHEWLATNLSYIEHNGSGTETFGHSYVGCAALQNVLGSYYTWTEAQTVCPDGWHLPSDAEWVDLIKAAGGPESLEPMQDSPSGAGNLMVKCTFNGNDMWEYYRGVNVQNGTHLCVIPAGYANVSGGDYHFSGFMSYAAFWTSDQNGDQGIYRYIYQENDNVYAGLADKDSFAASVRCVR